MMSEVLSHGCKYCDWTSDEPWKMVEYHMVSHHWEEFYADLVAAGIIIGPGVVKSGEVPLRDKLWQVLSKMEDIADLSDANYLVNQRAKEVHVAALATFGVGDVVETVKPNPSTGEPIRAVVTKKGTRWLYIRVQGGTREFQASPTTLRKVEES